ncbi:zinc-dependent alcohol dehydrogenase [Streptomyces sp. IBSNAI002]|uniref:zinc-dependent alcohol dehydrogenase n=1 Tax=Streptomyces sp. IBSNAI002 TaxID=3457500 RepID=UPI003FD004E8
MSAPARAWRILGGTPELADAPVRSASLPHGDIAVQVAYAGVCGSDLPKLSPAWPGPVPVPWFPGHEIVGTDTRSGDWVVVDPLIGCTRCGDCRSGRPQLCRDLRRIGWDLPGGFADVVRVPESSVVKLPALRDPAHGVLADPMAVAVHGVRCGLPAPHGRLGVIGSGALGICTAACAVAAGWDVHLAVRSTARLEQLNAAVAGPGLTIHHGALPPCDAVVDAATGQDDTALRQAAAAVRDGGTVLVQNAYAPGITLSVPLRDLFRRSVTLRGSFSYCRAGGRDDFRDALTLLEAGGAWADLLTRHRYPLGELARALEAIQHPGPERPIKVLLTPHP